MTNWLGEDEQATWRSYHRMRTQLAVALAQSLQEDCGISEPDYEVLAVLSEAPAGTLRARELRHELQWEKSRLAHHIRRMEERGLVAREACTDDPRAPLVRITDAGFACIRAAAPAHVARVRELFFDPLTAEQVDALGGISTAVLDRLAARAAPGEDADTDIC